MCEFYDFLSIFDDFINGVDRFQTLLAGSAAILAALIAFYFPRINEDENRKTYIKRAAISEINYILLRAKTARQQIQSKIESVAPVAPGAFVNQTTLHSLTIIEDWKNVALMDEEISSKLLLLRFHIFDHNFDMKNFNIEISRANKPLINSIDNRLSLIEKLAQESRALLTQMS